MSWHQDSSYWPLSPSKTVTAWLAIVDAGARTWRLGWRATRRSDATGGLEGTRREPVGAGSREHTPDVARRGALVSAAVTAAANTGLAPAWSALVLFRAGPADRPASPFRTDAPLLDAEAAPPGRRSWRHWS